jgi:hypothetical protein
MVDVPVHDFVTVYSPEEIVAAREHEDPEWDLALVQRDELWTEDKIRLLLDSLLRDYPIGSMLRVALGEESTSRGPMGSHQRHIKQKPVGEPSLVDGQQRAAALNALFTPNKKGHFYLNMYVPKGARRPLHDIIWQQIDPLAAQARDDVSPRDKREIPGREKYLDLSKWFELAPKFPVLIEGETIVELLKQVDSQFVFPEEQRLRQIVQENLELLMRVWRKKSIPVLTVTVQEPADVLTLFERVNRAGVPVSGHDLYFAAVKTFWREGVSGDQGSNAHEALNAIVDASKGLVNLWTLLSVVSRLTLVALNSSDVVPMSIDRLRRPDQDLIIECLHTVAPTVEERTAMLLNALEGHSKLKFGLRYVRQQLWEEVLAWAVVNPRISALTKADIESIEVYLLGASLFKYQDIFKTRYQRKSFALAVSAGVNGESFPWQEIIDEVHSGWANETTGIPTFGGREIPRTPGDDLPAKLETVQQFQALSVAVAQNLPIQPKGNVDWDHIVAAYWEGALTIPGSLAKDPEAKYRLLKSVGNFWFLDLAINRSAQEELPQLKFQRIQELVNAGTPCIVSSHEGLQGIEPEEKQGFEAIGELHGKLHGENQEDRHAHFDEFRSKLIEVIDLRAERIARDVFELFPDIQNFGFSEGHEVSGLGVARASDGDLAATLAMRLGIEEQHREVLRREESRTFKKRPAEVQMAEKIRMDEDTSQLIKDRREKLKSVLRARVSDRVVSDRFWPQDERRIGKENPNTIVFELTSGRKIELVMLWNGEDVQLLVKAYRRQASDLYSDINHVKLDASLRSSDEQIASEFSEWVELLEQPWRS